MLTINITNLGTGTNENANYRYRVYVNYEKVDEGYVGGHNRDDGWWSLLYMIAEDGEQRNDPLPSGVTLSDLVAWASGLSDDDRDWLKYRITNLTNSTIDTGAVGVVE